MGYFEGKIIHEYLTQTELPWDYIFAGFTVIWLCIMTWLSHQNGEKTVETSGWFVEEIGRILGSVDEEKVNARLRKAAHVVVFAVLTVLGFLTLFFCSVGLSGYWLCFVFSIVDFANGLIISFSQVVLTLYYVLYNDFLKPMCLAPMPSLALGIFFTSERHAWSSCHALLFTRA